MSSLVGSRGVLRTRVLVVPGVHVGVVRGPVRVVQGPVAEPPLILKTGAVTVSRVVMVSPTNVNSMARVMTTNAELDAKVRISGTCLRGGRERRQAEDQKDNYR